MHDGLVILTETEEPDNFEQDISASAGKTDTTVIVVLEDDRDLPHFPELDIAESKRSAANQRRLAEAASIVDAIKSERLDRTAVARDQLRDLGVEVLDSFWLVNALLVKAPKVSLDRIRSMKTVVDLDPAIHTTVPLVEREKAQLIEDTDTALVQHARLLSKFGRFGNSPLVGRGRELIRSDPYFDLELLRGGWVGLLDSGMQFSHLLFNSPGMIGLQADCVEGGDDCLTPSVDFNPSEACEEATHGTSSGAIVTANSNHGDSLRGVTWVELDSYRVFACTAADKANPSSHLDHAAALRGFQAAVVALDKVIVAEMQGAQSVDVLSRATDRAFDTGAVVITAVGDTKTVVTQPGSAHKTITVGTVFPQNGQVDTGGQGWGPTADGRVKPDVLAPGGTKTASGLTDTWLQEHNSSSGATPYVAGAAALLRNWLKLTSSIDTTGWTARPVEPGHVYAQLILSGKNVYPFSDTTGAGLVQLPELDGRAYWGKTVIDSTGMTVDIPMSTQDRPGTLDAALWWPEAAAEEHNFVLLELLDADGTVHGSSAHPHSVFQRSRAQVPGGSGTWTLRIQGQDIRSGSQVVYWTAHFGD
jgi:hypothetical protein